MEGWRAGQPPQPPQYVEARGPASRDPLWRSCAETSVFAFRFCQFPQEIVLQMVERCRIRKLQLLAHQYMIASKIEFYVSESLPEYFVPYQAERFRRLG